MFVTATLDSSECLWQCVYGSECLWQIVFVAVSVCGRLYLWQWVFSCSWGSLGWLGTWTLSVVTALETFSYFTLIHCWKDSTFYREVYRPQHNITQYKQQVHWILQDTLGAIYFKECYTSRQRCNIFLVALKTKVADRCEVFCFLS